jgi:phosphate butyryltransferase
MQPIRKLDELVEHVRQSGVKKRIAVAYAQDANTISALAQAVQFGFVEAVMIGDAAQIKAVAKSENVNPEIFTILDIPGDVASTREAVRMVKSGEADILMKGLVGTDKFLKAVLDKQNGLLPPKAVMSYVCAVEIPA